jgi:hypothetical protein
LSSDGSGTIYFGDQPPYWAGLSPHGRPSGTQFFRIADVKNVYKIVHEAMLRQKK